MNIYDLTDDSIIEWAEEHIDRRDLAAYIDEQGEYLVDDLRDSWGTEILVDTVNSLRAEHMAQDHAEDCGVGG